MPVQTGTAPHQIQLFALDQAMGAENPVVFETVVLHKMCATLFVMHILLMPHIV